MVLKNRDELKTCLKHILKYFAEHKPNTASKALKYMPSYKHKISCNGFKGIMLIIKVKPVLKCSARCRALMNNSPFSPSGAPKYIFISETVALSSQGNTSGFSRVICWWDKRGD